MVAQRLAGATWSRDVVAAEAAGETWPEMCPPGSCLGQQQAHPTLQRPAETGAAGQDRGAAWGPVGTQLLEMGALR